MPTEKRNQDVLLGVSILFITLGIILVALRCYVRIFLLRAFGYDDGLVIIALMCYILQASFVIAGVHYGLGRHVMSLSIENRVLAFEMTILWELLYVTATTFIKASIGASLLRLTQVRRWTYILWTGMSIDFVTGVVVFCYILFTCHPVEYQWTALNPSTPKGHCQPSGGLATVGYVFLGVTCAIYLLFAVLPIFMLWKVQIGIKTKASVMLVLSLGLVAMVANMVRLKYLSGALRGNDTLFSITDDLVWSLIECGMGMVAACMATYRPFLRIWKEGKQNRDHDGFQRHLGFEDIFPNGVKTTIHAGAPNNASGEEILGNDIIRMVEVTYTIEEDQKMERPESCESDIGAEQV